jgi:RNA polymerase sigma factor (sigma-70 family)
MADRTPEPPGSPSGLHDRPTIDLLELARAGNRDALSTLIERCLPALTRWAHGRLPGSTRDAMETTDLVQEVILRSLHHLDRFEARHVGALQAYLRQAVINRIRDEVRRVQRRPPALELIHEPQSDAISPLEAAIRAESYDRYRQALARVTKRDRALLIGRIEMQWSLSELASRLHIVSTDAARVAVIRAVRRLSRELANPKSA